MPERERDLDAAALIADELLISSQCSSWLTFATMCRLQNCTEINHLLQVRGAPAIAIVGCLSLAVEIYREEVLSKANLRQEIEGKLNYLVSARPTAVNMKMAAEELIGLVNEMAKDDAITVEEMKARFLKATEAMLEKDISDNRAIGTFGAESILKTVAEKGGGGGDQKSPIRVLTHCNTGSLATAG